MNIVIISVAYPYRGGIAQHTAQLYKHLWVEHNVVVMTFSKMYPDFLFPGKTQYDYKGVIPTYRIINAMNPFNWMMVAKEINRNEPDLIVFAYQMSFFAPCFGTISRLTKAPKVFLWHNIISHEKRWGDAFWAKWASKNARHIVQSHTVAKQLISIHPKSQYKFVPFPIYENFGKPTDRKIARFRLTILEGNVLSGKILLCFGLVRNYKGVEKLVNAVRGLDVMLYVVGENYGVDLPEQENVVYVNRFVSNWEANLWFSACDYVVLPYESASQSAVLKVAFAFEKFCIVSEALKDEVDGINGIWTNDFRKTIQWAFYYKPKFIIDKSRYSWGNMVKAICEF